MQKKFGRFLWVQVQLNLVFSVLVLGLVGLHSGISAFAGGMAVILGGSVYALVVLLPSENKPKTVLYLHFVAELAKLFVMFLVVLILYGFYQQAKWQWIFAGCLVSYGAYWLGLLNKS